MARGKDQRDFEKGFVVIAHSVTKTAQLAGVSIGTLTKVTSTFRSMERRLQ